MKNRTPKGASNDMATHEAFVLGDLLPLVVGHAKSEGHPTEMVALACFLSLSTVLQAKGIPRESLVQGITASNVPLPYPGDLPPDTIERLALLNELHFEQFDDLTLACMASNGTSFAHESLACTEPDDDTTWNAHVSMINSCNALTVLIKRLAGGRMPGEPDVETFVRPVGETLQ
ncbi:hypothetical protein [Pseudomonas sp. AL03]|uniref:hypothetical protein n=1 Tax=Pseudomonas sp. AL03 TaxID=3042230 RepID=UPI00249BFDBC|nr:hypothetical protein [Pseudomonas sp. AL03]MDI3274858.1 hypothetical protein [Pseudomonas sp. AL03]